MSVIVLAYVETTFNRPGCYQRLRVGEGNHPDRLLSPEAVIQVAVIRIDFVLHVKSAQQRGSIRNTKKLINYGYFLGRTVELKVSVAVCSLRLIVERIGDMGRDTDAHWSIYITAQIIGKQRSDLYQCKRE